MSADGCSCLASLCRVRVTPTRSCLIGAAQRWERSRRTSVGVALMVTYLTRNFTRTANVHTGPSWGASVRAGIGAGAVAAMACLGAEVALHSALPPRVPTLWSAFVAG